MKVFGTDYDGVIINIEQEKSQAFGETLNKHWGTNVKEAADFWMATGGSSRRYKFDYFYNQVYHKQLSDFDYETIGLEYGLLLKIKYYPQVKILSGAIELLEFARKRFDFLFVSSGMPMEELKYLADLNGVSKYFDMVLGTNQEYTSKKDHLRRIIEEKKPDSTVFIADSPEDMKISKEFSKTTSIAVLTNHLEEELKQAGADFIVQDLHSALDLLKQIP
jgi:phosphoglycolate phosphatase-like HAD superfamily hydrolase